ncbi:MAG: hypothetical protein O3A00_10785 [Planctomycetota bacterium]|nr:hypothetical protein [Planctomycetota bacterium]
MIDEPLEDDQDLDEQSAGLLPIRRLISRRYWKLFAVALLVLGSGVGLLQLGLMSARGELSKEWSVATPGFNPLIRFYLVGAFGLSAQLAVFIAWLRSESPRDFSGRYRVWYWTAGLCGLASLWSATDLHILLANTIARHAPVPMLNAEQLYWLIPVIVVSFGVLAFLNREVSASPLSCAFLWMAMLAFSTSAVIWSGLAGNVGWLPLTSSVMCGAFSIFSAMLFHTRYVAYVSADPDRNEAPLRRAARRFSVVMRMKRRQRRLRNEVKVAKRQAFVAEKQAAKLAKAEAKQAAIKEKADQAAARQAERQAKAELAKANKLRARESAVQASDSATSQTEPTVAEDESSDVPQRTQQIPTDAKKQTARSRAQSESPTEAKTKAKTSDTSRTTKRQVSTEAESDGDFDESDQDSEFDRSTDQHSNQNQPAASRKQRRKSRQKRRAA